MLKAHTIQLPSIEATSPTLAEIMRSCQLKAGFSRISATSAFVLDNPKAWLGNAYHEVLSKIPDVDTTPHFFDGTIEHLWNQAVLKLYERVSKHPLDKRYGIPSQWPGYHMALASVKLRAREIVKDIRQSDGENGLKSQTLKQNVIRERKFIACGGKLVGKPDVVYRDTIIDYKSGDLFEDGNGVGGGSVKDGFIRQLRIYAYLVKEGGGSWPKRGVLLPMVGTGVEVDLDPSACEKEATEAILLLDNYNKIIRQSKEPLDLAGPSPESCKWCPYKTICQPFWTTSAPDWSGQLDGAAVEGKLLNAPALIHRGAAFALSMEANAGTITIPRLDISPINPCVHTAVSTLEAGDRIRRVRLWLRQDGFPVPTLRTILFPADEVPRLEIT